MSKDYTDIVADLWSAFRADTFDWYTGVFARSRELDAGTFARPRKYTHVFEVLAHQRTRDALIAQGLVEEVTTRGLGRSYRLTHRACVEHAQDDLALTPAWRAWRTRHETEEAKHKGVFTEKREQT